MSQQPDWNVHDPRPPKTTHLGRAGEQLVAGHLLRLGYNATTLPVDTGVDILAHWTTKSSDSRVAQFQVKTTVTQRAVFRIGGRHLQAWWKEGINLAAVFWYDPWAPFVVIIPPSLSYMLTSGGYNDPRAPIKKTESGAVIVLKSPALRRVYIRNRHNDISAMVNRFDRIEATDGDPYAQPQYAGWSDDPNALLDIEP